MTEIQEFDTGQSIAESTRLIRNMFDNSLTKRQMDLIYAVISLVKPTDEDFKEYIISYYAIGKIFNPANPDCTVTVKDIEKAVKGIMNKSFRMEDDTEVSYYHYVSHAKINKKDRNIKFKLDDEVKQFYVQLQKGEFTNFLLKDILALSTTFQMNLFKWLTCNAGFNNDVKIPVDKAKLLFYGKEVATGRFIEKIDAALEKINNKTKMYASYEKIKTGKTITALKFTINNKYIKPVKPKKPKTKAQMMAEKERQKAMWERNIELQKRVDELENQIEVMKMQKNEI